MSDPSPLRQQETTPDDRLDSWKEIAAYLRRDVTTVQRWEKREEMPVHRHVHDKKGSVYGFRSELDAWARSRNLAAAAEDVEGAPRSSVGDDAAPATGDTQQQPASAPLRPDVPSRATWHRPAVFVASLTTALALAAIAGWWLRAGADPYLRNPIGSATFQTLTDFEGTEQDAAVSADGRFVAFLSDRDGRFDVWVTQVGTGQFYNLTRGRVPEIVNPSVRTLGFSPDGALVTFWARDTAGNRAGNIGIWAVPTLGGEVRPYLEDVAEFDWSADGARLVYHTAAPGDPMFVRDADRSNQARQIFVAPSGLHGHFPLWSEDQAFIYFVHGSLPEGMDLWRISPAGGPPERLTHHNSRVSHPVVLNRRTIVYLASDSAGAGPWLHSLDVRRPVPHRVSAGLERYTSLAGTADGRRLVATRATAKGTLWRWAVSDATAEPSALKAITLTTARGSSPRLGPGYLLYVSMKGTGEGIWKLTGESSTELWSAPDARILGGPEISRDGQRVTFSAEQRGKTRLFVMNVDGTGARIVSESMALRGAPAWTPDGRSITSAADVNGVPHLFRIPAEGAAVPLIREYAVDPVWSPAGDVLVYSGADIGTTFPLKAHFADGSSRSFPALTLTRGARRVRFFPGKHALIVMRGDIQHRNLWLVDLATGAERQLTNLPPDFALRDFDVSPDGREIVLERVQDHGDIVLVDIARNTR